MFQSLMYTMSILTTPIFMANYKQNITNIALTMTTFVSMNTDVTSVHTYGILSSLVKL